MTLGVVGWPYSLLEYILWKKADQYDWILENQPDFDDLISNIYCWSKALYDTNQLEIISHITA